MGTMQEQKKLREAIAQTYYNKNMESLDNYEIYKRNKLIKKVEYNKKPILSCMGSMLNSIGFEYLVFHKFKNI